MDQFNFKPVSTPSIKYLNWPSPVFGRFQNGCNWTSCRAIFVRNHICDFKSNSRCALVRFSNHAYDFNPNCTPLSSITTLNHQRADETFLLYRYWWNTRIFPFSKKSYLHRAQWRYYLYLSRVSILVSPWLLTWLANYMTEKSEKSCLLCRYFISIYIINRTLHCRLGIRILWAKRTIEWNSYPRAAM